jgi:RNA polymerase sigma-70 factor, ECF subfamily
MASRRSPSRQEGCCVLIRATSLVFNEGESVVASQEFETLLVSLLPKMRGWAIALTRNRAAADDLVQDTATKVLGACDCFTPGTNFSAWAHRIMVNQFITNMRSRRVCTDEVPEQPVPAAHIDLIALRELGWALDCLPANQKAAFSSIALEERSYEEVAHETGCAVGKIKSRVHRARLQLRSYMNDNQWQQAA